MKVSVLCVTHERPEFIPWLLWNFERLDWKDKELVIVDSSKKALPASQRKGAVYAHESGANVPEKRNIALQKASGDFVTWLDDDDWRHPDSLKVLAELVNDKIPFAGGRVARFVDLKTERMRYFVQRKGILFAAMLIKTDMARSVPFDETLERGSDIDWLNRIYTQFGGYEYTYEAPSLFLCHDRNLGNTAAVHYFNRPLTDFTNDVSKKAWGDTPVQLAELRNRLYGSAGSPTNGN